MPSARHVLLTSAFFAACATPTPGARMPMDAATTTRPPVVEQNTTPKAKGKAQNAGTETAPPEELPTEKDFSAEAEAQIGAHNYVTELDTIEGDLAKEPTAAPKATEQRQPSPLPEGTVVLHVGDSMADALGKSLRRELGERNIKNILNAKEATYIPQWAGYRMNFPALVAHNKPDLVIVTLGGNEVAMPDPSVRAEPVRRIVKTIGDRPCLWIAPPLWPGAPNTGILEVIRANCAPCRYVDSNVLIPDLKRLGDKVHPTISERKRWARFMIRWLEYNVDPNGKRPWDFRDTLIAPPPEEP